MIGWRDPDGRPRRAVTARAALRWGLAFVTVAAVHAGGVWATLRWTPPEVTAGDPPAPVMIDLAPIAVAPDLPETDVTPGPEMAAAEPQPAPEKLTEEPTPEPDPEPAPPDPEPLIAELDQPPPREPEPEIRIPDRPPIPNAAAVLAPPPAKRSPARPIERVKKVERKKPSKAQQRSARQTTAPPTAQVDRANKSAAPSAGAAQAPSVSPATWRGSLMAHLNRHKRAPVGASTGTAQVAFTIDRSGRVLSARLIGSSGDFRLDAEAASLPRRASPVPPPPAGIGGGTVVLTVPVRFSR